MAHDEFDEHDDTTSPGMTNGSGVDPLYLEQFGAGLGEEVAERRGALEPVANFGYYIVQPTKAIASFTNQKGSPRIQVQVEILEGPADTVGRIVTDSGGIYFITNRESFDKKTKQMVYLDEAAFAEKLAARKAFLKRIANVMKLTQAIPASFTGDALDSYAAQFSSESPKMVIEIRTEKGQDGVNRNRLVWESAAALNEPLKDKRGNLVPNKTALDEARTKIAEKDKAGAGRRPGGHTAGFVGKASTPKPY
jgi:hypothetical protein